MTSTFEKNKYLTDFSLNVSKFAKEQNIEEEKALAVGMTEKAKEL